MNILYLCADPGIDLTGENGGSIHIRSFTNALSELGHNVSVVCSSVSRGKKIERKLRAKVRRVPLAPWNRRLVGAIRSGNSLLGRTSREHPDLARILHNFTFAGAALATARESAADFVYERSSLWGWAGTRVARARNLPHVLEVNAPLVREQARYRGLSFQSFADRIERMVWRHADLVIAVSESLNARLREAGVRAERIRVMPNAADDAFFRADLDGKHIRRRFNLGNHFVIGFSGSLKPWHGVDFLLAAFREFYEANSTSRALIIGDGPMRESLQEQVRRSGLDSAVTFTGAVDHEEMPFFLAALDVAVAPYPPLDDFYYSPLKLFEYIAAGRAIVASRAGQIGKVIVDEVTGLLYEPGDRDGLVRCLKKLRENDALRRMLGAKARETSVIYTWSHNANRVLSWAGALEGRRVANPWLREKEQHGV